MLNEEGFIKELGGITASHEMGLTAKTIDVKELCAVYCKYKDLIKKYLPFLGKIPKIGPILVSVLTVLVSIADANCVCLDDPKPN